MKRASGAALALLLVPALPAPARAQGEMPDDARRLVVKVISTFGEGDLEPGSGVLLGADADSLYIATARHVVARARDTAATIRVTFHGAAGDAPARVRHAGGPDLDLAVLSVPRDSAAGFARHLPPLDRLGFVRHLRYGSEVRPVGCPDGECWAVPPAADQVVGVEAELVIIQSRAVRPGSSGGGLFDRWWELVALVTDDQPPRANSIRIDRVLAQLEHWGVPVQLRHATIPRAGYRSSYGVALYASTPSPADRLPAARLMFTRRVTNVAWHAGLQRFAPPNLAITALTGGVSLPLRAGQRLTVRPFAELGLGNVTGRYDRGGFFVTRGSGVVYVPVWQQVKGSVTGTGLGVGLEYVVMAGVVAEVVTGYWNFATPQPLPTFGRFQLAAGVRRGV